MDGFVVADGVAARFEVAGGAAWINQLRTRTELIVPGGVHRGLREAIMRSGVQNLALPDDLTWESRRVVPRPRLMVGPPGRYNGACPLLLEFAYETTMAPHDGGLTLLSDSGDVLYQPMSAHREGAAFQAASDLVFKGLAQPSGYTEPLLHAWRAKVKAGSVGG